LIDILKKCNNLNRYKLVQKILHRISGSSKYTKIFGVTLKIPGYNRTKVHKDQNWFRFGYNKINKALKQLDECFFTDSESGNKKFNITSIDINLSEIEELTRNKGTARHQMRVMLLLLLYGCKKSITKQLNKNLIYFLEKSIDNNIEKLQRLTYTKLAIIQFLADHDALDPNTKSKLSQYQSNSINEEKLINGVNHLNFTDLINLLLVKLSSDYYVNETNIHALTIRKDTLLKIQRYMGNKILLDNDISKLQRQINNLQNQIRK
jgi:hypothetical protein